MSTEQNCMLEQLKIHINLTIIVKLMSWPNLNLKKILGQIELYAK